MTGKGLPEAFEKEFRATFGSELFSRVTRALTTGEPITSIRANRLKVQFSPDASPLVPWSGGQGLYLPSERPIFGADPFWHMGSYYVQEAGSMFLSRYLEGLQPGIILDLCAAPGGKSTLLRDFFSPLDRDNPPLLIANEPMGDRAKILRENLIRWGSNEVIVTRALPADLASSGIIADLIVVDAPCSGEGMFRKDPGAIDEWSEANVALCVERQREILSSAWEMLSDGGVLIYSTCTLNSRENEDQLSWLIKRYRDLELITLSGEYDHLTLLREGVYRFMPGVTASEGLTIFGVRKTGATCSDIRSPRKRRERKGKLAIPSFLDVLPPAFITEQSGIASYLSPSGQETLATLKGAWRVQILSAGVPLGETRGKDFLPHQAWAMSRFLSERIPLPRIEVTEEEAFVLLRRATPERLLSYDRGLYLLTLDGLPLMIIKHLGNRINSLFPKEWAIHNGNLTPGDIPQLPLRSVTPLLYAGS